MRLLSPGRVVFLATFALFAVAAAPGLYLRDAGELTTAAFTLGIAHETGFALWCLGAKALALVPLGEVATRVNLLSALTGAGAAALAFAAVRDLGHAPPSTSAADATAAPPSAGANAAPPSAGATAAGAATRPSAGANVAPPSAAATATRPSAGATAAGAATRPSAGATAAGAATRPSAGANVAPPSAAATATRPSAGATAAGAATRPSAGGGWTDGEPAALAAALGAAVLTAAGLTLFRAATVAEVYAPATLALAWGLRLWTRAARGDRRAGLLLALLGGLSLGLHAQVRLLLAPAAIGLALWRLRRGDRWPLVAPTAVALGLAVVAYLPLRAARAPAANWADPRTLGAVAAHLQAARIRRAFVGEMFHDVGAHALAFARQIEGQLGLVALLFALVGLLWLWAARERRPLGVILTLVLAGDGLYAAAINPMAIADLQVGHPTALVLAIAAGAGVLAAARRLGRGAPWAAAALAVLVTVPAALADVDGKLGLGAEAGRWSGAALAQAPPRALVLLESDDLAAGAAYEQNVAGARPDVTVLVRQLLWDTTETAARMARGGHELRPGDPTAPGYLRRLVDEALPARAVLWEPGQDAPPLPVEPDVPLYQLRAMPPPLPPARPLAERLERLLAPARDPLARQLLSAQLSDLGRVFLQRNDVPRAAALFEAARAVRPGDAVAATDLAVVRARRGDFAGALALVEGVLEREPDRLAARLNAARYRLRLGDLDGAARDFARAHERAPGDAAPLVGLARVAERRGDRAAARRALAQAQALAPDDGEVRALARELHGEGR